MGTNNYIARLKAQLDQAIIQREHWKQLAENRNSIVVTEVCPESRSVEEYTVDADSVRASWRLIRSCREQIEALRAENAALRAKQGERQEAVVYAVHAKGAQVDHHCPLVSPDMAADYLPGCATPLYTSPQPGPDVRTLVSADDVRDACANAVSVFAEETNASQCREVAEYMREVLLAQIARRQDQPK